MNRDETLKIMSALKAAYPNSYRDLSRGDALSAVNLWHTMLAGQPYEVVSAAVKSLIATSKWVPTIAEVNAQIHKLTRPAALDELEAWELVSRAIRNGIYGSREEFDRLPPVVQRCIGSHNQLREWAMMEIATVQSVVQSNFLRTYRVKVERQREYDMLPPSVQTMLAEVAGQLKSLPKGGEQDGRNDDGRIDLG